MALLLLCISMGAFAETQLERIENSLVGNSSIEHIHSETLLRKMADPDARVYLFDVRTEEEFAVSHLDRATRLDPDTRPEDFLREYGGLLEENTVIFYCSTGRRSTELAESIVEVLELNGETAKPANLRGGIFRWHNEFKPLVDADGATELVHPYNWFWKRLLSRKDKTGYQPD